MKQITLAIIIFCLTFVALQGQDRADMRQRLESQKVAFITHELDLTSQEAQVFWPIYNEYMQKLEQTRQEQRDLRSNKEISDLSEAEASDLVESILAQQEEEVRLQRMYAAKLKSAISSKKIAQLFILEKEFKEKLMNKIRRKMNNRMRKVED